MDHITKLKLMSIDIDIHFKDLIHFLESIDLDTFIPDNEIDYFSETAKTCIETLNSANIFILKLKYTLKDQFKERQRIHKRKCKQSKESTHLLKKHKQNELESQKKDLDDNSSPNFLKPSSANCDQVLKIYSLLKPCYGRSSFQKLNTHFVSVPDFQPVDNNLSIDSNGETSTQFYDGKKKNNEPHSSTFVSEFESDYGQSMYKSQNRSYDKGLKNLKLSSRKQIRNVEPLPVPKEIKDLCKPVFVCMERLPNDLREFMVANSITEVRDYSNKFIIQLGKLTKDKIMNNSNKILPPLPTNVYGMVEPIDQMTVEDLSAYVIYMIKVVENRSETHFGVQKFRPRWWPNIVSWHLITIDNGLLKYKDSVPTTTKELFRKFLQDVILSCFDYYKVIHMLPQSDKCLDIKMPCLQIIEPMAYHTEVSEPESQTDETVVDNVKIKIEMEDEEVLEITTNLSPPHYEDDDNE